MNILWIQPNQTLALTSIFDDQDPKEHAAMLQERGDIPVDWTLAATSVDWKPTGWAHESHRWSGSTVVVDFEAAKNETKTRLRREREPLMAVLDVEFQRALEDGADTAKIVAEKRRLRDVTNLADLVTTLDGLKAISV